MIHVRKKLLGHDDGVEGARAIFPLFRTEETGGVEKGTLGGVGEGNAGDQSTRLLEAETGKIEGREVWEEDERAMALGADIAEHLEQNFDELGIHEGEVREALVDAQRREPSEDR